VGRSGRCAAKVRAGDPGGGSVSKDKARTGANAYGYFDEATREYVITRPDTPTPWLNYIGEGR